MNPLRTPPTDSDITNSASGIGFWLYIMTDCILFATLFATFAVLGNNTFGGPGAAELFDNNYVLLETVLLLTSSFTIGLSVVYALNKRTNLSLFLMIFTMFMGIAFLTLEIFEFYHLINDGNSWTRSGFLSAYFTLVGTHGLHISAGIIWASVLVAQFYKYGTYTVSGLKRLILFSLFWHFLDIIWIFIFSYVYLLSGAI